MNTYATCKTTINNTTASTLKDEINFMGVTTSSNTVFAVVNDESITDIRKICHEKPFSSIIFVKKSLFDKYLKNNPLIGLFNVIDMTWVTL